MIGRASRAVARWVAHAWGNVKASTDASLLAVPRFLGLLYGPIDSRLPIDQAFRKAVAYRLPPHVGWRHALGGVTYLLFIVLVATGVLLSFYYRPSAEEAYPSIRHIVSGVRLGWLIRDLHVWAANVIVIAVLAHMARVFLSAAYAPPRETNWLTGMLLLFLVVAFGATGYLLPWDQGAYWTVTEGLNAVDGIPVVGSFTVEVLRGDPIISGATLSRFFAVHVIVLPWIALALLVFHFMLLRKHGVAPPRRVPMRVADGVPFFPTHLLRSLIAAVLVLATVISAAVLFPRPIGDPADPARVPGALVSSWVLADVSRALAHYLGSWGFGGFALLGLALALVPLFEREPERGQGRRRAVMVLGLVFYLGLAAAWLAGRQLRSVPPAATVQSGAIEEPGR